MLYKIFILLRVYLDLQRNTIYCLHVEVRIFSQYQRHKQINVQGGNKKIVFNFRVLSIYVLFL